jgi:predicted aconitase
MVDEKTEEIKISEKEISDLNNALEEQKRKDLELAKVQIEKDVREKMETENKLKTLEEQNKKLLEDSEKLKKETEEKQRALMAEIETIKSQRQGLANIQNPFQQKSEEPKIDLHNEKVLDNIEEESRKKFLEKYNMLPNEWGSK